MGISLPVRQKGDDVIYANTAMVTTFSLLTFHNMHRGKEFCKDAGWML